MPHSKPLNEGGVLLGSVPGDVGLFLGVPRAQVLLVRVRVEQRVGVVLLPLLRFGGRRRPGWDFFGEPRGECVSRPSLRLADVRLEHVALLERSVRVLPHEEAELAFEEDLQNKT